MAQSMHNPRTCLEKKKKKTWKISVHIDGALVMLKIGDILNASL